jgi:hypothetical protein
VSAEDRQARALCRGLRQVALEFAMTECVGATASSMATLNIVKMPVGGSSAKFLLISYPQD